MFTEQDKEQIEGMDRRQQRQQIDPKQLGSREKTAASWSEVSRKKRIDQIVRNMGRETFQ
jgi:hypothetical protein